MKVKHIFLLLLTLICTSASLFAQHYAANGYWQVHTDPQSKNTVVMFFDGDNQPLYQETLSRKYVRLTRANIHYFDKLLAQLMSRSLLANTIRSYELVADSRTDFREVAGAAYNDVRPDLPDLHGSLANVYVVKRGKMKVILKNPSYEDYHFSIVDEQLRDIYYEQINSFDYGRWFDISMLAAGKYKVRLTGPRSDRHYKLTVDKAAGYKLEGL